jgi:hypothetical protein
MYDSEPGATPPSPPRRVAGSGRHVFQLLLCGALACLFIATSVLLIVVTTLQYYGVFGFHSVIHEFWLYRFVLFSTLPWGFNAAFGGVFGIHFGRDLRRFRLLREEGFQDSAEDGARGMARLETLRWLVPLVAWWWLFNLPVHLTGVKVPETFGLLWIWPTGSMYMPVAREMSLLFRMGNFGLLSGFFLGCLWAELREKTGNGNASVSSS